MSASPATDTGTREFVRRVAIVALAIGLAIGLWLTFDVLLAGFFGAYLAVLLRRSARQVSERTHLTTRQALALVVVALVALLAGAAWLIGPQLVSQIGELFTTLPQALQALHKALEGSPLGRSILSVLPSGNSSGVSLGTLFTRITGVLTSLVGLLAGIVLVVAVAVFGAVEPGVYRRGIVRLTPPSYRERMGEVLDLLSYDLWRWTSGQLVAMCVVGILTGGGLSLLSVPSALALGVIAALLDFIPMLGPVISTGIAMLVGFTVGLDTALYVLLLCTAIQQFEGNVLVPWLQKRTIWIPPIVSILAIAALAVLFGPIGVILSGPLTTTMVVLVQAIYVEDVLGDRMRLPRP